MSQAMTLPKEATELPAHMEPQATQLTPIQMAYQLMSKGHDLASVKEMLDFGRELERDAAEKAFNTAITAAKAEITPIARTQQGHNGKYADLSAIAGAVDPILSRHGLHYRHKTEQSSAGLTVTCILSHEMGHKEETAITAGADNSGNKNSIQALGSTQTYLMRYTLVSALGLATMKDDDGQTAGVGNAISEEQVLNLNDLIDSVVDAINGKRPAYVANFLKFMKVDRIEDIAARDYQKAVTAINSTRNGK